MNSIFALSIYKIIEDGIEYDVEKDSQGNKYWSLNGKRHRENGPAIEHSDGYKAWYKHGKHHREDGPARIFSDGTKQYFLNNHYYSNITSDEEWIIYNIIT